MTRGQLENALGAAMAHYQAELTGHGPMESRAYVLEDMVLVRYKGILSKYEQRLALSPDGKRLVKQMRQVLREQYRDELEAIVQQYTGARVISSHSDISTRSGERIEIYVLERNLDKELTCRK